MPAVWTEINQHQWPVPLPQGNSLEHLRWEILRLGAEYVWIDVVCLRQRITVNSLEQLGQIKDAPAQQSTVDELERLRQDEWKVDVPTIGNIYREAAKIVCYISKKSLLDSPA